MTILKYVSLGNYFFQMAILLRNVAFLNKVLVNSEVWYPINESDLKKLVKMDEILIRSILEVNESTPKELLYLELGIIPLVNIVKCRRIMYLHYLLTTSEDQLLYKFFKAQLRNPSKGDWTEVVKQDLKDFNITSSFKEISLMKNTQFKNKVKKACKKYTFDELIQVKNRHEKGKENEYEKLVTNPFFLSNKFTIKQSKLLFKLRSRMLDVKMNFKKKYKDDINLLVCELCGNKNLDDQNHVIVCTAIENNKDNKLTYSDLFSKNLVTVQNAIIIYEKSWKEMWKKKSERTN